MLVGTRWLALRRGIDAIVVLISLPVLALLGITASVAVFIEDRHAPIVRLPRVGRGGAPIDVIKIRSMRVTDNVGEITGSNDNRITAVGEKLRTLRLDEIPQVWQVLRGEMSLIGPRPESPKFVDLADPEWQNVLRARPAIAGMTQVIAGAWEAEHLHGDDPEVLYRQVALPAKLQIDRWYVEHASPVVDAKIVASVFLMLVAGFDSTPVHRIAEREIPGAAPLLPSATKRSGP